MNRNIKTVPAIQTVLECWGSGAPEWVNVLASYCDQNSQAQAAHKIGRSASLVNQVLKKRYTGNLSAVQSRVEAAFIDGDVKCPVLGSLSGKKCLNYQSKPYNGGNHISISLFRSCRKCPHNIQNREKNHVK